MYIEKHSTVEPVVVDYPLNSINQILSFTTGYFNGKSAGAHAQARAQLMYATKGVMKVITAQQVWVVSSCQALWVPANAAHEVISPDGVEVKHLFFDAAVTAQLPATAFAFDTATFFSELIARIAKINTQQPLSEQEYRLMLVLLDEVRMLTPSSLHVSLGKDEDLLRATNHLARHKGKDLSIEELAAIARVRSRTLTKLFVSETGLTYSDWCAKLKLLESVLRLQGGASMEQVAHDLGYADTSAYTAQFRNSLGKPPCVFLRERNGL